MTFTELLITMALSTLLWLGVQSTLSFSIQQSTRNQQLQLATQLLNNIEQELLLTQQSWSHAQEKEWQSLVKFYLPNAQLILTPHHVEIHWPSAKSIAINCQAKGGYTCLGTPL